MLSQPSTPTILAVGASRELRQTLDDAHARVFRVEYAEASWKLAAEVARYAAVIWELDPSAQDANEEFAEIVSQGAPVAMLCVATLTSAAARQVLWISRRIPAAVVCLKGIDDIPAKLILATEAKGHRSAQSITATRVLPRVANRASSIIAAAIALSTRRASVHGLSCATGLAVRTIQWRLAGVSLPSANRLLGWCLALDSAWRIDTLAYSPKRVATGAGFASVEAWAVYCRRHVDDRPHEWIANGGFPRLLDRFTALVADGD